VTAVRNRELAPVNDLLGIWSTILGCTSINDLGRDVLYPLCGLAGAQSGVFLSFRMQPDRVGDGVACGISQDSLFNYSNYFHRFDPIAHAASGFARSYFRAGGQRRNADYRIARLHEIADQRSLRKTEYFNEFLRPFGIGEVMALFLPLRSLSDEILCIGLHRSLESPAFSDDEVSRVRSLLPALRSTLSNVVFNSALNDARSALECAPGADGGIAILNEQASLIFANESARRVLQLDDESKRQAIGSACLQLPADAPSSQIAARAGLPALQVEQRHVDGMRRYVLRFAQAGEASSVMGELGLSAREQQVTQHVLAGLSNESIANQMDISIRTVENHLRSVYAKAMVNSRTQLIARLLRKEPRPAAAAGYREQQARPRIAV